MKIKFLGKEEDRDYISFLSTAVGKANISKVSVTLRKIDFIAELAMMVKKDGITHFIVTQESLLPLVFNTASDTKQTIEDYAGSYLYHEKAGAWVLVVNPLKQCVTVSYGKFLLDRYVSKIFKPDNWLPSIPFSFKMLETADDFERAIFYMAISMAVAVDIETRKDLSISSVSYSCLYMDKGKHAINTFVVPLPQFQPEDYYHFNFEWIRKFNAISTDKIFQNGKYDCSLFQYYNCPVMSYLWDTLVCHHSWYSELPKDLGSLGVFYIRETTFWKNEGDTGNDYDLYKYNALDTWGTMCVFLQWILEAPEWAKNNYLMEFPVIHPNFLMESTGLATDDKKFDEIKAKQEAIKSTKLAACKLMVNKDFNPGSPPQTFNVLKTLGCTDLRKADAKALSRAAFRHPFYAVIIEAIVDYRKSAKLISSYLNKDKLFKGRMLYSISPTTETGRNKSSSHHFSRNTPGKAWMMYGANVQNIPRVGGIKEFMVADNGFLIMESDYAQAESRDTGYITGDTTLIANVDSDKDFHKSNASMFFGVAYDSVSKDLRQLAKPVNHGANYMMGDETLIDSMGLKMVYMASKLLRLPSNWAAKQITKHLLSLFHKTYPVVAVDYPRYIKFKVAKDSMLVNPYGWVRWCFSDPNKSPMALRSYVAHLPQGTNGQALNKAVVLVFNNVWKKYGQDKFKMCAQVHDSILSQYKDGHEYVADEVKYWQELAAVVEVEDIKGIKRTMKIPVDVSLGGRSWQDSKDH